MSQELHADYQTDAVAARTQELLNKRRHEAFRWTDRFLGRLLIVQWLAGIAVAIWISPRTWTGATTAIHSHAWAALLFGGAVCSLPVVLAAWCPGKTATRHSIAVAQMLLSALLIHLLGGRIETHFHVFGSLAFLALYRDWRVLITATIVVALDHYLRGVCWPESVFGLATASPWRWLEHTGWVVFEVSVLTCFCRQTQQEMIREARRQALLESTNERIEREVAQRTGDLQQSREKLKDSERRVRLMVEAAPNGMVMIDAQGTITFVNNKMEELFDYPREQLLGQPIELLVPRRFRDRHPEHRRGFFQNPGIRAMGQGRDLTGVRKDGSEFPVEIGLNPIYTDQGLMVMAAVVDITQRKKAEQRIEQTLRELECRNRELDEFTYVASHDLQEPVRKIVSFGALLKKDIGGELNEHASQDLAFIVDAAQRMRDLVQDLLALSRAGRAAMKSVPVALGYTAHRALDALDMRVKETGAHIEWDRLPEVIGDPTVLTQVYQNLIGNALKFIAVGRAPRIRLTAERSGQEWILGVCDNGIGIKAEYAERIFVPFQRLHSRTEYEGTGIGLAICKKNVERHNGRIWVESVPGKGTHFKFTLPVTPEEDSCDAKTNQQAGELSYC